MNEPKWKPGDTVQLKSGGPVMTIRRVGDNGQVVCNWFVGQKIQEADFYPEQLVEVTLLSGF